MRIHGNCGQQPVPPPAVPDNSPSRGAAIQGPPGDGGTPPPPLPPRNPDGRRNEVLPANEPNLPGQNPGITEFTTDGKRASGSGGTKTENKAGARPYTVDKVASRKAGYDSYNVSVEGAKGKHTVAVDVSKKGKHASIDEVARGLAAVPEVALSATKTLKVEPEGATPKGVPKDVVGMSRPDGSVELYGIGKDLADLHDTIQHEAGHQLDWAMRDGKVPGMKDFGARWDKAQARDKAYVDDIAQDSDKEDFARTWALYQRVKGSPEEAAQRKKYGAKFALIDEVMQ
ncbi:MAG TPA: hypothetical protein VFH51_08800, partial [Myxococcota bacterium]|nr:hypothetical protein [Myxococcota bacterium]